MRFLFPRARTAMIGFLSFAGVAAAFPVIAATPACHVASRALAVPLVELFTSEGCDSCPPADRWLSGQYPVGAGPATGTAPSVTAIALAYHVDYWDRLGWRDRFGSARFTERQYEEMRASGDAFVFTPQVRVQGHDVPGWNRGDAARAVALAGQGSGRAVIELDVAPAAEALRVQASATVGDARMRKHAVLWLAYADSGHVSNVAAGENRGVTLRHDHVVRSLHGPYPVDAQGIARASVALAAPAEPGAAPTIVGFVQDAASGDVLQAVAVEDCGQR